MGCTTSSHTARSATYDAPEAQEGAITTSRMTSIGASTPHPEGQSRSETFTDVSSFRVADTSKARELPAQFEAQGEAQQSGADPQQGNSDKTLESVSVAESGNLANPVTPEKKRPSKPPLSITASGGSLRSLGPDFSGRGSARSLVRFSSIGTDEGRRSSTKRAFANKRGLSIDTTGDSAWNSFNISAFSDNPDGEFNFSELPACAHSPLPNVADPAWCPGCVVQSMRDAQAKDLLGGEESKDDRLGAEFRRLAQLQGFGNVSSSFRSKQHNRHRIYPYTHSVVRLRSGAYVNACHMKGLLPQADGHQPPGTPVHDRNSSGGSGVDSETPTARGRAYIAAMGPLPATVNNFWHMAWEQSAACVAMLTQLSEHGREKCHKYWPEYNPDRHAGDDTDALLVPKLDDGDDDVMVIPVASLYEAVIVRDAIHNGAAGTGRDDSARPEHPTARHVAAKQFDAYCGQAGAECWNPDADLVVRHFVMRRLKEEGEGEVEFALSPGSAEQAICVTQIQCRTWSDHSLPDGGVPALKQLRELVNRRAELGPTITPPQTGVAASLMRTLDQSKDDARIVVHCSAGVGRTGVYIAADVMLTAAEAKDSRDSPFSFSHVSGAGGSVPTVPELILRMRRCRMKMVTTERQYIMLHSVLE